MSWPDCGRMPSSLEFTGGKTGLGQIRFYSPNSRSAKGRRKTPRRSLRRVIAGHFWEPSVFRCLRAFTKVFQVFLHILAGKLFWYWWRTTGAGDISASVSGEVISCSLTRRRIINQSRRTFQLHKSKESEKFCLFPRMSVTLAAPFVAANELWDVQQHLCLNSELSIGPAWLLEWPKARATQNSAAFFCYFLQVNGIYFNDKGADLCLPVSANQ